MVPDKRNAFRESWLGPACRGSGCENQPDASGPGWGVLLPHGAALWLIMWQEGERHFYPHGGQLVCAPQPGGHVALLAQRGAGWGGGAPFR